MATQELYSTRRNDRLIITTILTNLVFFHEAGFEFRTERKEALKVEWWNPSTWGGHRWVATDQANQPNILEFIFMQGPNARNPADFAVSNTDGRGYF